MTTKEAEELSFALETINVANNALNRYHEFAQKTADALDSKDKLKAVKDLQTFIDDQLNPFLKEYHSRRDVLLKKYGVKKEDAFEDATVVTNDPVANEKLEVFLNQFTHEKT